ncbi:YfcZ/YiiS family protein [Actinobacillus capsulatus]|uniref:YfcZ/YiiS family protein n=1 Tax=Actinobacillus capsulatus TaxID=717 RepID=UPI0003803E0A|nr:YfcZ/YiiS family protein [Actinobacillus capsulatus]
MHKTIQQKAVEAHNMCKLKGDSILDNSDRQIAFEAVYDSEEQAQQAVEFFTEKAKSVETEACVIQHNISQVEDGFLMQMQVEFSCQAEVVLFQMAVR